MLLHAEQFGTNMCKFHRKQNSTKLKPYECVKTTLPVHRCWKTDTFYFNV